MKDHLQERSEYITCLHKYDSSDTGDVTLANSYDNFNYGNEIPSYKGNRTVDFVDGFQTKSVEVFWCSWR